jgi:hypothetical protein
VGRSTPAHTAFTLLVENFNTRGHFRRSHVTFVDLCGSQSPTISSPEQLWINKSISALCDVISMLAATREQQEQPSSAPGVSSSFFQPSSGGRSLSSGSSGGGGPVGAPRPDIPHRNNRLIQLLRDALGGNAKAAMVVSADAQVNTVDEVLTALTYAYFFKSVKQSAIPYDIPPELQRLNLQMGGIPLDD